MWCLENYDIYFKLDILFNANATKNEAHISAKKNKYITHLQSFTEDPETISDLNIYCRMNFNTAVNTLHLIGSG